MNLILLFQNDFISENTVKIDDHRLLYIQEIHQAKEGDQLTVGLLNGKMGKAVIENLNPNSARLYVELNQTSPPPLPITLIIALPRPKVIRRLLQHCCTLGVKNIILLNSYRVEKSYWQTPLLSENKVREYFIEGLEQAKDTLMPTLQIEKRFKPFVEDRLSEICAHKRALLAHPYCDTPCPKPSQKETVLVIGPEGGFIPYEVEKLQQAGCQTIHLGKRILKTETAVTSLLAKLFHF